MFGAGNCVKSTDEHLLDTIQSNVYNHSYRYSRAQGHRDCCRSVLCDSTGAVANMAFARTVRTAPLRSARKRCTAGPNQLRQPSARNDTKVPVPACASFLAAARRAPQECSTANSTSASNLAGRCTAAVEHTPPPLNPVGSVPNLENGARRGAIEKRRLH